MSNTNHGRLASQTAWVSVAVVGVFSLWGAWSRRWISDDGLIVLRTVRNLIAGNGPVFNVGERVEANTSTLWQYLIYAAQRVTGAQLEYIAMGEALVLSVAAMVLGAWASSRVYRGTLVAPAGALVYLALPPARDFFTSGLEWGLSIFYLAGLWALLVWWARDNSRWSPYALALWAGLSWLVRPELALYGGVTGIVLLASHRSWRAWLGILGAALPLPAAYQVFRMGYYGLITPHTAVAKSAADAAWGKGFVYLADFVGPYWLWLPLAIVAVAAVFAFKGRVSRRIALALGVLVGCGLLHVLYVVRVGGDFMHGRMLLLPLFAILLPVFVLPIDAARRGLVGLAASAAVAVWALTIVLRGHHVDWSAFEGDISVVDEREFWTYATHRAPGDAPKTTVDFNRMKLMNGFGNGIRGLEEGDAIALRYLLVQEPETYDWMTVPRESGDTQPPTLYLVNMGMSSMNSPLDVRVLDNIGLATPLAARQPRIADGRIGHDKTLSREWQVAASGADLDELPEWINKEEAKLCRQALQTADFQELFATYQAPLDAQRFISNIKWSLGKGRSLQFSADPRDYLGN